MDADTCDAPCGSDISPLHVISCGDEGKKRGKNYTEKSSFVVSAVPGNPCSPVNHVEWRGFKDESPLTWGEVLEGHDSEGKTEKTYACLSPFSLF